MRALTVLFSLALITSLAVAQDRPYQLPTATEVFRLRSLCAGLGDRILEDSAVGTALTHDRSRTTTRGPTDATLK
jgi:hypothetical protein